jgi:hypothetical protein
MNIEDSGETAADATALLWEELLFEVAINPA